MLDILSVRLNGYKKKVQFEGFLIEIQLLFMENSEIDFRFIAI